MNLRKAAEEMGIPYKQAAWCRVRYLRDQVKGIAAEIGEYEALASQTENPVSVAFAHSCAAKLLDDLHKTAKELHGLSKALNGQEQKQDITDEQIEAARDYPIERLIEFDRTGNAVAFCHPDKRPSLHWWKAKNRAYCFPCSRTFSAIDVLMERDGLTFVDAVKRLAT